MGYHLKLRVACLKQWKRNSDFTFPFSRIGLDWGGRRWRINQVLSFSKKNIFYWRKSKINCKKKCSKIKFCVSHWFLTQIRELLLFSSNSDEAVLVAELVEKYLQMGVLQSDIGVIAPYWSQISLIRSNIDNQVK